MMVVLLWRRHLEQTKAVVAMFECVLGRRVTYSGGVGGYEGGHWIGQVVHLLRVWRFTMQKQEKIKENFGRVARYMKLVDLVTAIRNVLPTFKMHTLLIGMREKTGAGKCNM